MSSAVSLMPLIGVPIIAAGFALRINPITVVVAAAIATGFAAHHSAIEILALIGSGFIKTRNLPLVLFFPLAVIGLLERHGLRERAQMWISGIHAATAGRLLIIYLLVRELSSAVGLTGLGGHPQMVRPLIAPMAEGATLTRFGDFPDKIRFKLRGFAAATDNIGFMFGEDIFVAFGAVVLMVTFLKEAGISVNALHVALWGIPTAIVAFFIHATRLLLLDRSLHRALSHPSKKTPNREVQRSTV
jgi:uncharacterized membrane protein